MTSHLEVVNEEVHAANSKKNCDSLKDPLGSVESLVMRLEVVIMEVQGLVEDPSCGIKEPREQIQGAINNTIDELSSREDMLEALITSIHRNCRAEGQASHCEGTRRWRIHCLV